MSISMLCAFHRQILPTVFGHHAVQTLSPGAFIYTQRNKPRVGHRREARSEGSVKQMCASMNKNRVAFRKREPVHLRSAITGKIGSPVTIRQPQVREARIKAGQPKDESEPMRGYNPLVFILDQ
jgi:hypothetical protein